MHEGRQEPEVWSPLPEYVIRTYYPNPAIERLSFRKFVKLNNLKVRQLKRQTMNIEKTQYYKKSRNFHLPLTGSLYKPSNIYKFYRCWNCSLRFADIRKYMKAWIWNSNNPYIWLYCTKGEIRSLSLPIFNLKYVILLILDA